MVFKTIFAAVVALVLSAQVFAQQESEAAGSAREAELARAERERELDEAQREMDEARRQLESAARQIARLSAGRFMRDGDFDFDFDFDFDEEQFHVGDERAYLGVGIEDTQGGALVNAVTPGSPAADAGILTGDIISTINGRDLSAADLRATETIVEELARVDPGAILTLTLDRDGAPQTLDVETKEGQRNVFVLHDSVAAPSFAGRGPSVFVRGLGSRIPDLPGMFASRWRDMELATLTAELGGYFGTDKGLLVVRAPDNDDLDLRDGDVVLEIGGREPNSPQHAMRILTSFAPGETLALEIMRQQRRLTIEYAIPASDD